MKEFQVWMEGYAATGNRATARYFGTYEAETFEDAILLHILEEHTQEEIEYYWSPERLTWWGCRFFQNGNDAVKSFG